MILHYAISDGFDFLGFNIKLYNDIVLVKPAGKRVKRLRDKIGEIISTNQAASAEKVIEALNPVIRGWCNYYRFVNSTDTFDNLSHWIWGRLWQWTERRHHDKGKQWRKNSTCCPHAADSAFHQSRKIPLRDKL